ncbi:hypothetical protein TBR22_A30150 [Luteitalea sp. TBR-22]|uniref:SCO family protein n=1 Tax=Luteitalea sp. TBR-22 TaxID=2802971 RepID=UPI001AF10B24|nr:SCO family protein [Luteitalea sp. TBR-22]BCS33788.1 hypothetical protein TBR22_A30150 [Luteitalea sp. TBR-22]
MTTRGFAALAIGTAVIAALVLPVHGGPPPAVDAPLPYYDEATFTPHWSPVAHRVGPFRLQAHTGAPFTDDDVRGQVHVVSFLYTQCPNICPRLMGSLRTVADRTRGTGLRVVAYSVTPETDTPAILAAFASRNRADADTWTFVTGARTEISRLARDRYFAMDARSPSGEDGAPLVHSEKLLLVDGGGRIRGIYNGLQPAELDHLVEDAALLTGAGGDRPPG